MKTIQTPASLLCPVSRATITALCATATLSASAQSLQPAAFVANNGNLEGAISSFVFDSSGAPVFVDKHIIAQRPNTQSPNPGTNAYGISIRPDGRYLITSHATESTTLEQLTVVEVLPDASLAPVNTFTTPDSPLDVVWVTNDLVAVTRTRLSAQNEVILYEIDPEAGVFIERDRENTGTFTGYLAAHPSGRFLYAGDSNTRAIYVFSVGKSSLTPIQTVFTPGVYPLGLGVSNDGARLFAAGGISSGGDKVLGYDIAADGTLTDVAGSPFISPGASPAYVAFSDDASILFVGHGTDATVRSFTLDTFGVPTYSGFTFDVGLQGSIGDIAVLGGHLLITDDTSAIDGITGLYSFDILDTGEFTANGPAISSNATAPTEIAVWQPPSVCPSDIDGDLQVALGDLTILLAAFGACSGDGGYLAAADLDSDGCISLGDLTVLLAAFGSTCS